MRRETRIHLCGSLLTTPGADYADDRALAVEAGYEVR